jgi:hypothetical protein
MNPNTNTKTFYKIAYGLDVLNKVNHILMSTQFYAVFYFKFIQLPSIPRLNYSRYAAPSTGGFERICPEGRCRDASRFS